LSVAAYSKTVQHRHTFVRLYLVHRRGILVRVVWVRESFWVGDHRASINAELPVPAFAVSRAWALGF
jgi:hypothetical protein